MAYRLPSPLKSLHSMDPRAVFPVLQEGGLSRYETASIVNSIPRPGP